MTDSPAFSAKIGDKLPSLVIPITASFIVSTAIASRDYQPVHHDTEVARQRGSSDIFMNILTTQGLVSRLVTDWTGPGAQVRRNAIKLGATNYPGDTMTMTGSVADRREVGGGIELDVAVAGRNSLGEHVSGVVTVFLSQEASQK